MFIVLAILITILPTVLTGALILGVVMLVRMVL
jgi:hypothetical protein